jgi:hypothetical protein
LPGGHDLPEVKPGSGKAKPPAVFYMGFRTTPTGREYRLRVAAQPEPLHFVLFIPHAAFAAREARFQDAPDLCFAKLQRELEANPDLEPGSRLVVTTQELEEYRIARDRRPPGRQRKRAGA